MHEQNPGQPTPETAQPNAGVEFLSAEQMAQAKANLEGLNVSSGRTVEATQTPEGSEQAQTQEVTTEQVRAVGEDFLAATARFEDQDIEDVKSDIAGLHDKGFDSVREDPYALTANNVELLAQDSESDPDFKLRFSKLDYLAAVEAKARAMNVAADITALQQGAINELVDGKGIEGAYTGGHSLINDLIYERQQAAEAATDPDQKDRLSKEVFELTTWAEMLEAQDAKLEPSIKYGHANEYFTAVREGTTTDKERAELAYKTGREIEADTYFAKYIPELAKRAEFEQQSANVQALNVKS